MSEKMSINFIMSRTDLNSTDFSNAIELKTEYWIKKLFGNYSKEYILSDEENTYSIKVELTYDEFADYDYYTMYSICHDGTMIFEEEAIYRCLLKPMFAQTYYSKKKPPDKCKHIKYTLGNLVFVNEYGDKFSTLEKPWISSRTSVFLPLKYEIIK